jgi:hypothetical protein
VNHTTLTQTAAVKAMVNNGTMFGHTTLGHTTTSAYLRAPVSTTAGRELGSLYSEIKAIIAMGKYFPDDGLPHWKVPAGKPS